jgi:pimeloyl-ACP methyl ester carboxylesterase
MSVIARIAALVLLLAAGRAALAQDTINLSTRPGVTQSIYVTQVSNPAATVLLFPGSTGVVRAVRGNFLIRTAPEFAALGVNVTIVDAPSDQSSGMSDAFRMSAEHATDVTAVIATMRQRAAVPVWLVGTSRGTTSVASLAARIGPPAVAGAVLTSTVWSDAIPQVPLEQIRVPVFIVHNRDDGCSESPFLGAAPGVARLRAAPAKELMVVQGGTSRSKPCEALSPHGYYGIEAQVVPPVVAWIKAH